MIIRELTEQECIGVLRTAQAGHLACAKDGQPYVVPVTVAFDDRRIYSFSLPGQKVDWMRQNPKVCVQTEDFGPGRAWKTVVVQGTYEELPDRLGTKREREHAWSLLSRHPNWWEPGGLKPVTAAVPPQHLFYRINIETMSGRQAVPEE